MQLDQQIYKFDRRSYKVESLVFHWTVRKATQYNNDPHFHFLVVSILSILSKTVGVIIVLPLLNLVRKQWKASSAQVHYPAYISVPVYKHSFHFMVLT